jgi:hypothetical protein
MMPEDRRRELTDLMFTAEDFRRRLDELEGWPIAVTTYRLKDTYYCQVDNVDPGARIARGRGASAEKAEGEALAKAKDRLATTVRRS